jgi:uncharacterized protein YqeY
LSLPQRLRTDLVTALRARDKTEVSMIRTLIAAIENAEAVDAELSVEPKIGLNHDEQRRQLDDTEIAVIVARERAEIAAAVARYRELGLTAELAELEERMAVVGRYIEPMP